MAGIKSKVFKVNILKLILNNIPIAGLGDAPGVLGSTSDGNVYIRVHNTDLVDADNAGTEATYAGYVAGGVPISRSVSGFTIDEVNAIGKNTSEFKFGKCTDAGETIRYFSIWMDGATQTLSHRLFWGQLSDDQVVSLNSEPTVPANYLTIKEN